MIIMSAFTDVKDITKYTAAASLVIATSPLYALLLAFDINDELKHANDPENICYDKKRPTPNTIDFPNGVQKLHRSEKYNAWMRRIFS